MSRRLIGLIYAVKKNLLFVSLSVTLCHWTLGNCEGAEFPSAAIPNRIAMNTGINSRNLTDQDYQMLVEAGVKYLRIDLQWSQVEMTKGVYSWSSYDTMYQRMTNFGLKPVFILAYNNGHYNTDSITMNSTAERNGYAAYAAAAVARYDEPGIIWELWNEQNTDNFWKASTSGNTTTNARERATNYMGMVDTAVPAMRAASADSTIIAGGVLDPNWSVSEAWFDEAFSRGLIDQVDGVSVHWYAGPQGNLQPPENRILTNVTNLRSTIASYGGSADFPILNTEWGVKYDQLPGNTSQQQLNQAQFEMRMFLLDDLAGVKLSTWYEWKSTSSQPAYAFINSDYSPRPNYIALDVLTDQLNGLELEERLTLASNNDFAVLYSSDTGRKLVVWTSGSNHNVTIPVETALDALSTISMLGTSGSVNVANGQIVVNVSGSPQYIDLGPVPLWGDYNGDGTVDAADYTVWRNNLGNSGDELQNRSPSSTGPVSSFDYAVWKGAYGESVNGSAGGSSSQAIPEPVSLALLLLAAILVDARSAFRQHRGYLARIPA